MHTIKNHSETQGNHRLKWKLFTKKDIRPVPGVHNFSSNHTISLVPWFSGSSLVIYMEGEWGLKERGVTAYGKQEELVSQCSLASDEGT